MRWKPALNAFAITFGDRFPAADSSARTVTGVNDKTVFAETIPPADPYAKRTPADPKQGTMVATIEGYVIPAEQTAAAGCS